MGINLTDHDLLNRVDQKLNQLSFDVKDIKDNLSMRIGTIEGKIIIYDQLIAENPPKDIRTLIEKHDKWISDFKLTWKIVIMISVVVGGVVTWILNNLINYFNLVHGR